MKNELLHLSDKISPHIPGIQRDPIRLMMIICADLSSGEIFKYGGLIRQWCKDVDTTFTPLCETLYTITIPWITTVWTSLDEITSKMGHDYLNAEFGSPEEKKKKYDHFRFTCLAAACRI